MKKIPTLITSLFLLGSVNLQSQDFSSIVSDDSSLYTIYKKLLDREFTQVLTGQKTNFGTFGAVSTADDITTFNGHFPLSGQSSIGLNLKGGSSGGIVPILQGENVSSNISVGFQFNLGIYSLKDTVYMDATQFNSFLKTYDSLLIHTQKHQAILGLTGEKLKLERGTKSLEKGLKTDKLKKMAMPSSFEDPLKRDSVQVLRSTLEYGIKTLTIEIDALDKEIQTIADDWIATQEQVVTEKMVAKYKKSFQQLAFTGYDLRWISLAAQLNNRSFKLFTQSNPREDQINKESFNGLEFGLSFNRYRSNPESWKSFYRALSLHLTLEDNFGDLSKVTLKDQEEVGAAPNQRIIESTTTAYTGDYETHLFGFNIDYNHYHFINYNQTVALHINPTLRSELEDINLKIDGVAGVLLAFKNKEDKSIVNTELFYQIEDLFRKSGDEDEEFIDRSSLGIRLSFPIQFIQSL